MISKIFAFALFFMSLFLLAIVFLVPLELPMILGILFGSFVVALFGVVTYRHGFKNAVRASHKGQPEYRK